MSEDTKNCVAWELKRGFIIRAVHSTDGADHSDVLGAKVVAADYTGPLVHLKLTAEVQLDDRVAPFLTWASWLPTYATVEYDRG